MRYSKRKQLGGAAKSPYNLLMIYHKDRTMLGLNVLTNIGRSLEEVVIAVLEDEHAL